MKRWGLIVLAWVLATGHVALPGQGDELEPGYWERTPLPVMGLATYYSPGTMDWVWDYRRQRSQVPDCPECVGAVALLRAGDIGRKIWLQPWDGELAGPFLVVDCAHTEDVEPLLARGWVVDLSYDLGQLWGMAGPLDDVIVWADPAEQAEVAGPAATATPGYINPEDIVISAPTEPVEVLPTPIRIWPTRLPAGVAPSPALVASAAPTPVSMEGTAVISTPTPIGAPEPAPASATAPPDMGLNADGTPSPAGETGRVPATPGAVQSGVGMEAASSGITAGPETAAVEGVTPAMTAELAGGVAPGGSGTGGASLGEAAETMSRITLARPGGRLLESTAMPGQRSSANRAELLAHVPTPDWTPRATSAPIIPGALGPQVPIVTPHSPATSPLERLWQALLRLIGQP